MKNLYYPFVFLVIFSGISEIIYSQTADEFTNRRKEVIGKMEPGSVLILRSSSVSGMFDYSRRGGYLYYLTGIDEPDCALILFAKSFQETSVPFGGGQEVFFIRPANTERINWDPQTLGLEGAKSRSGFSDVRPSTSMSSFIGLLLNYKLSALYMDVQKPASVNDPLSDDEQLIVKARDHGAVFRIMSPSLILDHMVSKKTPPEIELMRRVAAITAEAQCEAARSITAGLFEYQIDAIIRYVFSINGSGSVSFPGIIGSGINSVVLHWMENSRKMEDGDIVVVDCGAEYQMYCADITRSYPVSGKFTERQKAIYEIVLKANEEAIRAVAPGVKMAEVSAKADSVLSDGMFRIGLIKDRKDFKKYYYHGLSHQIGLKGATGGLATVLEPGMIITIEPGIYVREEKTGVRIEDDVLVTTNGYEVLSKNSPKQVSEVEILMKEKGTDIFKNILK